MDHHEAQPVIDEVAGVLSHSQLQPIFQAESIDERRIEGVINGQWVHGQIDRLVKMKDELWLIDYKTDRRVPERAENVPSGHAAQLISYHQLLRPVFPQHPLRCFLLYTARPSLLEIRITSGAVDLLPASAHIRSSTV